jgi:predicted ATPase
VPNFFILTGTPGTGKTSALKALQNRGFAGVEEPTRQILTEQLAIDGPGLPAKNPLLFIEMMLSHSIAEYEATKSAKGLTYFDRGIPDLIAYAIRFGVEPKQFEEAAQKYFYNQTVFIFPPWKEIFVNDSERKLTFEMSLEFHQLIVETYQRLNFCLVEVPFKPIGMRADFIIQRAQNT